MNPIVSPLGFDDAVVLRNDHIWLSVSPRVGRMVGFGPAGGDNLLWINTEEGIQADRRDLSWGNWGGDKVWPTQQSLWRYCMREEWPPEAPFDSLAWEIVERQEDCIVIRSQMSTSLGVTILRRIELVSNPARVRITNTMARQSRRVFPVELWSVSQVRRPVYTLLDIQERRGPVQDDFIELSLPGELQDSRLEALEGVLYFEPSRAVQSGKIGTLGSWVAGVYAGQAWVQHLPYDAQGCYPDGSSMQVYVCPRYVELETLGSLRHLPVGASMSAVVDWLLVPIDAAKGPTAAVRAIRQGLQSL